MAKAKEELFWIGRGVIHIDGTEYDGSKPLPVDKMASESLKKQIEKGNIGEKIRVKGVSDEVNSNLAAQLEAANKKIADLTKELADLTKELEEATKPEAKK